MAVLLAGFVGCGHPPSGAAGDAGAGTVAPAVERVRDGGAPDAPVVRAPAEAPSLTVHRARAKIRPTGHFDVGAWGGASNTHTLLDDAGVGAVPVSECRFLWGQDNLYIFFYAGDLDLQVHSKTHDGPVWKDDSVTFGFFGSSDAVDAATTKFLIAVTPTGVMSDGVCPRDAVDLGDPRCELRWESHALFGTDSDGTLNKVGDFDEEWAVEVAVPLRSIGVDPGAPSPIHIGTTIKRCEVAHDGPRACGAWGNSMQPADLTLADP